MGSKENQKWKLDLVERGQSVVTNLASPPGYSADSSSHNGKGKENLRDVEDHHRLLTKRAWDLATGPMKQLPMTCFIMYMAGNSIGLIQIMMAGMLFARSVTALCSIGTTFRPLENENGSTFLLQRFVCWLGHYVAVSLAVYKFYNMGVLPTHASDWLDYLPSPIRVEYSHGSTIWT